MEITVEHLGGVQFEIKARQHVVVSDQPAGNGGFDEGMTPPEMLLASLGSCAGFYAAQYLKSANWPPKAQSFESPPIKPRSPPPLPDSQYLA